MIEAILGSLTCNLCGGRDATVLSNRSRDGGPLRTLACRGCGLVRSDPRPHDARQFYEHDYRLAYKGTFAPKPKHVLRAGHVALSRLAKIQDLLVGRMKVLDVGSGGGEFAYLLRRLGHDVHGVEPNRGYAEYAAGQYGLDIRCGFIDDIALDPDGYDLITIWHVLEHAEDPRRVLGRLRAALRHRGRLVVEVPNVEATCQSPSSSFHEAHLYNFNACTLEGLARSEGLGLRSLQHSSDGGNLTAVFVRAELDDAQAPASCATLQANHDRVVSIVRGHTPLMHALSLHPYRRFAARMARAFTEWRDTRRHLSGRERLDRLYAQALARDARPAAPPRLLWPLVAASYVAALLLEWLLLDLALPRAGTSEPAGVALWLALQTAVLAVILRATSRPRSAGEVARVATWAAPLFILPAVC